VQSKEICVEYCNSCDNGADIFTKPLGRIKFELFREMLGILVNPFPFSPLRESVEDNGDYVNLERFGLLEP